MKKVINKGYTLKVVSWENDGDNYNTKEVTYEDKELAIVVAKMCKTLFCSKNNGKGEDGIGNAHNDSGTDKPRKKVLEYMKEHPILWESYFEIGEVSDNDLIGYCMEEYNYELLGSSEWYYSRVCESVNLTYSKEDIYLEEISF